jgi:hypothetical protein
VCYKVSIRLQEVSMQTHTNRFQRAQLELFHPRSEAIQWHKLPLEIQEKTVKWLARLLREYSGIPHRPAAKEDSHE